MAFGIATLDTCSGHAEQANFAWQRVVVQQFACSSRQEAPVVGRSWQRGLARERTVLARALGTLVRLDLQPDRSCHQPLATQATRNRIRVLTDHFPQLLAIRYILRERPLLAKTPRLAPRLDLAIVLGTSQRAQSFEFTPGFDVLKRREVADAEQASPLQPLAQNRPHAPESIDR